MVVSDVSDRVDNDELAAFISSTLKAISGGILQAHEAVAQPDRKGHTTFEMPEKVSFDIAVTAKRNDEVGGGLKVQVFSIGAKKGSEDQTVSRISFEVPWRYVQTQPSDPINHPKSSWMA